MARANCVLRQYFTAAMSGMDIVRWARSSGSGDDGHDDDEHDDDERRRSCGGGEGGGGEGGGSVDGGSGDCAAAGGDVLRTIPRDALEMISDSHRCWFAFTTSGSRLMRHLTSCVW